MLDGLPDSGRYSWLLLRDRFGEYGQAALAESGDCLEVHLEMTRRGPQAMRSLRKDMAWLHAEARRLGKSRILGLKGVGSSGGGGGNRHGSTSDTEALEVDRIWVRFTSSLGFVNHGLVHTAILPVDPSE